MRRCSRVCLPSPPILVCLLCLALTFRPKHQLPRRTDGGISDTMASEGLQLLAFTLALSGASGGLTATLLPNWKVNVDMGSNILTAMVRLHGLWMDCTWYSTGMFSCTLKYSILALPTHVQAARAAMVLACILSALGLCTSVVGMKCTRLGGDRQTKRQASFAAGVFFLCAGFTSFVPTVWYTKEIVANFLDLTIPESNKYEPGGALYIGFISAMLLFSSGIIFCTSCIGRKPEAWLSAHEQQHILATQPEGRSAYHLKDYV